MVRRSLFSPSLTANGAPITGKNAAQLEWLFFVTHCGLTGRVNPQNVLRNGAPIQARSSGVKSAGVANAA